MALLSQHFCHMVACAWLDAEFDACASGMQTYTDYTPISFQRNRVTKRIELFKAQPFQY